MINLKHIKPEQLNLITNPAAWLINQEGYLQAVAEILIGSDESYTDKVAAAFKALPLTAGVSLINSDDLDRTEIPDDSIAYYRIDGVIRSQSRWSFGSKTFVNQLMQAENSPSIAAHFLHISSGGGEAWYMDRVFSVMQDLQKPVYAHIEKVCASAAYYIACSADKVYAETPNCVIGSIGVMCSFTNMRGLFERFGIKDIELYADNSDLKNKRITDALYNDKPEELIKKDLNPIRDQFASAVKSARTSLATLDDTHPVMRGEDYRASEALTIGLIDGIQSIATTLSEVAAQVVELKNTMKTRAQAIKYL